MHALIIIVFLGVFLSAPAQANEDINKSSDILDIALFGGAGSYLLNYTSGWERKSARNLYGVMTGIGVTAAIRLDKESKYFQCVSALSALLTGVSQYYVDHPERDNKEAGLASVALLWTGMLGVVPNVSYCTKDLLWD